MTAAAARKPSGAVRAKARSAAVVKQAGAPGHVLSPGEVPRLPWRTDLVPPLLSFVVYGVPAPQGSKAFKGFSGGKPVLKEQSDLLEPWRDAVREMSRRAIQGWESREGRVWRALDEPVMVSAVVTVPATEAATARRDTYATGTPDLDKLQRAIGDALAPRPLKPSDGAGYGTDAKTKIRSTMMADRRKRTVLHDDSRIVAWDHCMKVYPATTVDSLGFSGATIQVWRMADLEVAARRPARTADGLAVMSAADVACWGRPLTGETWAQAAERLWADPGAVLAAADGPVVLRGRGLSDDALRTVLRLLALSGPTSTVAVIDEPIPR